MFAIGGLEDVDAYLSNRQGPKGKGQETDSRYWRAEGKVDGDAQMIEQLMSRVFLSVSLIVGKCSVKGTWRVERLTWVRWKGTFLSESHTYCYIECWREEVVTSVGQRDPDHYIN